MRIQDFFEAYKNKEVSASTFTKIRDQWGYFLEGREVDTQLVPREVFAAWQRSKEYGVDPYNLKSHPVDPSQKEYQDYQQLLEKYKFFFTRAAELVKEDGFSFSLNTVQGLSQIISNNIGLSFPGFIGNCSEKTVGLSASIIAKRLNEPVVIYNPFFYRQDYFRNVNSAAAPIHNEKKELIGCLTLNYFYPEQSVQAYGLVSLLSQIFDSLYLPMVNGYEEYVRQLLDCLPQGIVYTNNKDKVEFYNDKVLEILNINKNVEAAAEISKHLAKYGIGLDTKAKGKRTAGGKTVDFKLRCDELKDKIKDSSFKFIQIEKNEKNAPTTKTSTRKRHSEELFTFEQIIGESALIQEAKRVALKVAKTSVPVLLHGETGTGKEMFAQAIHMASPRRQGPFIAINCGALPGELVESELFGYEEGSFTGALKGGKIGKIEAASGGTLFLDEVESMPLKDQIKLLRVLSTRKVQKIGSTKELMVDIRLITATKTDLLKLADAGQFREDLFYRISTFIIELPPLCKRKEDIFDLAQSFADRIAQKYGLGDIEMDEEFIRALESYSWRGNVRELEHAIERAIIMLGENNKLCLEHLADKIQESYKEQTVQKLVDQAIEKSSNKQGLLALAERMVIEHVLESVNGNISAAAEQLGINRRTIYNKLQEKNVLKAIR
ncbi:MAG: sigma 54-interacting transcriptional regulator [Peptococcaceae bacterium]|nr:sigma 54-interacting transcriptional regulator [Peptococcaceae bacterium]